MYQGTIQEIGQLVEAGDHELSVRAPDAAKALAVGGAVALDGVQLCVEAIADGALTVRVSSETRRRTRFKDLREGERLNVELPLCSGQPIQGHLVQGHVEAVGRVVRCSDEACGRKIWIQPPERFLGQLEAKGAVAIDGVSLTVAEVVRDRFAVVLVPQTLARTTLDELEVGRKVNLESDMLGKLARRHPNRTLTALQRVVAPLPWSGPLQGKLGVEQVVQQLAAGGTVMVWDPEREGEGDLIAAGADLRPETFTFFLTQAFGHTTVPCSREVLERLEIPALPGAGDHHGTAMHLPVDLSGAVGTGVSASERAATVRRLAHPDARAEDFVRPGHVFPLGGRPGGLHERAGHTEATIALAQAAKLAPVGICCEIMNPDGTMSNASDLERFALHWGLPMVDVDALLRWL